MNYISWLLSVDLYWRTRSEFCGKNWLDVDHRRDTSTPRIWLSSRSMMDLVHCRLILRIIAFLRKLLTSSIRRLWVNRLVELLPVVVVWVARVKLWLS